MTKYVKYVSETEIEYPPKNKGNICNYDLDIDLLIQDGYKRLIEAEKPEGEYTLTYREGSDYVAEVITVPTPEEMEQRRRETFLKEFFQTSLGWIRRKTTMANGEIKDFLSDLLPSIAFGVNMRLDVKIIAYDMPDFTHDITDWTIYQHERTANLQFIQDCMNQLNEDFRG